MVLNDSGLRAGGLRNLTSAQPDSGISRFEFSDDSDTSVLVDSWGTNNGTLTGGSYTTDGVFFDGSDDYGVLPNGTVPFTSEFSVALWFKSSDTGTADQVHWGLREGGGSSVITINHSSDNLEAARFEGSTTENISTNTDLRDGSEHLVVLADGTNGAELFVDDGNSKGTAAALNFDFGGEDPGIGRRGGQGGQDRYSKMTAIELRTYDKRLTSNEVSNLYNTGRI